MGVLIVRVAAWPAEKAPLASLRKEVFMQEQEVPHELEFDGLDDDATHFLALLDGAPVACARIRMIDGSAKIERMAVRKAFRGLGHGRTLLEHLLVHCRIHAPAGIYLDAQVQVQDCCRKSGFRPVGEHFLDANIEHVRMLL